MSEKVTRKIHIAFITIVGTVFLTATVFGMTTYGAYMFHSGLDVGIRAWAFESSPYKSASARLTEGTYDSGWHTSRDVTLQKVNDPRYTAKGEHKFNK